MKNNLREITLGVGLLSLAFCTGCETNQAKADTVQVFTNPVAASAPVPVEVVDAPAPQPAAPSEVTNAPTTALKPSELANIPAAVDTNVVQAATVPHDLDLSPALTEVVKLIQAGVSTDVVMAYVTNSTGLFNVGSNEILYLHDLGTPPTIITALIQVDSSPGAQSRRQSLGATQSLPQGIALNTPATNVYPTTATTSVVSPPEPTPVAPPAGVETAAAPAVSNVTVVQQPVSVSYFESELSPYGSWVYVAGYGRCWRPTVSVWNSNWRPYADGGRWLWTDQGWYWYSDYSWGWAPFHYGRWFCPPGIGWVWYPDVHWGPAWVSWRHTSSHYGWAPLPPAARWVHGHGFYHNSVSVGFGFEFGLGFSDYVFVSFDRFCDRRPYAHFVDRHHSHSLYRDSKVVNKYVFKNNTIINNGAGVEPIVAVTRGNVKKVALRDTTDFRDVSGRRERLQPDGQTLAVVRPSAGVLATRVPASGSNVRAPGGSSRGTTAPVTPTSGQYSSSPGVVSRPTFSPKGATQQPVTTRPRETPDRSRPAVTGGAPAGNSQTVRPFTRPSSTPTVSGTPGIQRPITPVRPSTRREPIIITGNQNSTAPRNNQPVVPSQQPPAAVSRPQANPIRPAPSAPFSQPSTPSVAPRPRESIPAAPSRPTGGGAALARPATPAPSRPAYSAPARPSIQNSAPRQRIESPRPQPSQRSQPSVRSEPSRGSSPRSEGNRGGGGGGRSDGGGRGRGRE